MHTLKFLLILSFVVVQQALDCYDCEPADVGQCVNPKESNSKTTFCEPDFNTPNQCFSIYYLPEANSTELEGYYRGCLLNSSGNLTCDYIQKILTGNVIECKACSEDLCNVTTFDD